MYMDALLTRLPGVCTPTRLSVGSSLALLLILLGLLPVSAQESEETTKPVVREAVQPETSEIDLSQQSAELAVAEWQPGQPVRVIDDLKTDTSMGQEDTNKPVVREAVQPREMSEALDTLPVEEAASADDPVRVVDDLKQSDEDVDADDEADQPPEEESN